MVFFPQEGFSDTLNVRATHKGVQALSVYALLIPADNQIYLIIFQSFFSLQFLLLFFRKWILSRNPVHLQVIR